ncbi:unnamed protein product [Lymnaea stagnalis]|uniref:Uncharacterized protein n=1 Tax=Lymnaea stagnalis TaxID=6523 RepID=A0AAV2H955_LYMST
MFEAVFDTAAMSAHQKNPGRKDPNCFTNASTNITLCAGNKVIYHLEGTRLGVYSDKGRDNSNIATMKDRVTFVIKTAGIYLVNLNISIIDVTLKNYLGLFVNDRLAMACPEGGIKCSTNYDASFDFRICNINGVLKLNVNDSLDVRTMQSNTTIRIAALSNSFFTIVLLQKQL